MWDVPTAKHSVGLAHDTPPNVEADAPAGFGLATTDQLVPSQRSTNVSVPFAPTATQLVALAHDTALNVPPTGPGVVTADQTVPSQRSTTTPNAGLYGTSRRIPTATQLVALAHDTPDNGLGDGQNGLGLGVTDQPTSPPDGPATNTTTPQTSATATAARTNTNRRLRRQLADCHVAPTLRRTHPPGPSDNGKHFPTAKQHKLSTDIINQRTTLTSLTGRVTR